MSRPVGGYKCRSWRLKKKNRKWFHTVGLTIWHKTFCSLMTEESALLMNVAYKKYSLFNRFFRPTTK